MYFLLPPVVFYVIPQNQGLELTFADSLVGKVAPLFTGHLAAAINLAVQGQLRCNTLRQLNATYCYCVLLWVEGEQRKH